MASTDAIVVAAPCDKQATARRIRATRPPDWRYRAATEYVAECRRGGKPMIPADPIVMYAVRALGRGKPIHRSGEMELMDNLWSAMSDAMYYGVHHKESAVTSELDACLIKGWSWKEAQIAGCPVSEATYRLYAALFMDLTGMEGSHSLVHDYLFEPGRYAKHPELLRSHILAYYGKGSAGLHSGVIGYMCPDDMDLIRNMIRGERAKQMFDYVMKNVPPDAYVASANMEAALKATEDREFQDHMKDRDDAGSGSLDELASGLEVAIRAYSQNEIDSYDKDGMDFGNQYTKRLVEINDGKENLPR